MSETLQLARQLISRRSLTPADKGCLDLIGARLAPLGFNLEGMRCGEVDNLWARRGNSGPLLCFAGHTDVVPPGPVNQWHSDPFTPEVRDGMLYGRGASDMKGPLAAFITAIEKFVADCPQHRGSIAVLLTSDEEGVAVNGTVRVVEALRKRNELLDYCIVAEPTSVTKTGDTIKNGRRGSLSGTLIVKGVQGHIAYPHLLKNPIHLAAPVIADLAATVWDEGNEYFPPTSWQISNIHGGTGATNVVPGTVEILFNFRHSTASTVDDLKSRFEHIIKNHIARSKLEDKPAFEYDLQWEKSSGKPYLTPRGNLVDAVAAAIREVTGLKTELSTSGGTSDGRFIADICPQVIELGPLNATIHKINECVAVADLDALSKIYYLTLQKLLTE